MRVLTESTTHRGYVRSQNQDALLVIDAGGLVFLAVADGMGGHSGGETASRIITQTFSDALRSYDQTDDPAEFCDRALELSLHRFTEHTARQRKDYGMGTTFTAALVKDASLFVSHIGDSRLYLQRNGQFVFRTTDHNMLEESLLTQRLEPELLLHHPLKHILTRCVGGFEPQRTRFDHYGPLPLQPNDLLLLCSDGLHDYYTDKALNEACSGFQSLSELSARLLESVLSRGARDNVSFILARIITAP